MEIFSILFHSIGSLVYGVLLTAVGMALLFLLIKSWRKDAEFAPVSYIVGAVLFVFLAFQSVLLCGAITVKNSSHEISAYINRMVDDIPEYVEFSTSDSQQILDMVREEYPIVSHYFDWADFEGHNSSEIADAMVEVFNKNMNWYILRRIGWSLFFVMIGAMFVIKTMPNNYRRHMYDRPQSSQRRAPVSTRTTRRRR